MSQQTYPVTCECGTVHDVTGGQAGSAFPCGCGKTVEVPTLGALKRSVGESAVSADLEIEYRLAEKSLPVEDECVLCDLPTADTLPVSVVCERSEVKSDVKWWYWVFLPLGVWFVIGMLVAKLNDRKRQLGRDVSFRLPVRVCEDCRPKVRTVADARDALRRSPLYARLLAKYPHAAITPPA